MLYKLIVLVLIVLTFATIATAQDSCQPCGISEGEINAYPHPNVIPLVPNDSVLYDRVYRRVEGAMDIYDAPNGNVISTMGAGYTFVTLLRQQDGWAEISPNHWVRAEILSEDVPLSRYAGVELPGEPLPYPMAWALRHIYPSNTPGGEPNENYAMIWRYTRVNIYATVVVDGFNWYQIGVNKWVHQFNVAVLEPIERPAEVDTDSWVSVDLYEQVAIAYEGNTPVFATLVSSGLPEWSTNEGLFHIYLRYERTVMSGADGQPDFYYLEEVPWTMYFDDDIALHGTFWHDGFGYRQSHGCVNLSITDAQWLYQWVAEIFVPGSEEPADNVAVYVYSSGEYQ